jgi:hypothetical protein
MRLKLRLRVKILMGSYPTLQQATFFKLPKGLGYFFKIMVEIENVNIVLYM